MTVFKCWDRSDDVKQFWAEVSSLFDRVLGASDQEMEEAMYNLLDSPWFDKWFTVLVARSDLSFDEPSEDLEKKVAVFIDRKDREKNGTIWFSTPYGATSCCRQLNNPAMNQKLMPFIHILERLDVEAIKSLLTSFKQILEKEYQAALKVHAPLREMLDSYSRWMFKIAFTNLSNSPAVIEKAARVVVTDSKTKTECPIDCTLAKMLVKKEEIQVQRSNAPISVRAGETIEFAVVSTESQREMDLGTGLWCHILISTLV